ncbi:hypothetical protein EOE67_03580 [Rheinheimera riviphila]|uniref:Glycosyltransferase family 1 protein n=1 Tax=Rheinheimera riviphila TaxID=1834037 RepID=A0A437R3I7_9GAMM|nr:hypothetical protein [Rheinheimera riviphila]RVU41293.1 hypothetical protein EOE67_03580 [Rheinheimera riviphila]
MKILLVGEFSSVHHNLKAGLLELGHQVTVVSNGDGWKNVAADIQIPSSRDPQTGRRSIRALIKKIVVELKLAFTLRDYDVVQFVNPLIFSNLLGINQFVIRRLMRNNHRSFLLAAGDDCFYWQDYSSRFRYSTHSAEVGLVDSYKIWLKASTIRWNRYLAAHVNGVIPIMYEYQCGYVGQPTLCPVIPIPIAISDNWVPLQVDDKVNIYFPGNNQRAAFKGNEFILPALERLQALMPDAVAVKVTDRISFTELMQNIDGAHLVIDQTNAYSYGVSGALVLSRGRVLLSGAEPESLAAFGIAQSPVVNLKPDSQHIFETLCDLVRRKSELAAIGLSSREYALEMHQQQRVARKFVAQWTSVKHSELPHASV